MGPSGETEERREDGGRSGERDVGVNRLGTEPLAQLRYSA